MKRKQLWIFVVCYFGYTAIYIARLNLSMAAPAMKELGILSPAQLGLLGSVFSVIYALGRLVNGSLGDTCIPWKMICLGLGLVTVSNLLFSLFPPFWGLLILWGGNAYAQSMMWSSVLCVLAATFSEAEAKRITPYMGTAVAAGNVLGIVVNSALINAYGLRWAFVIPGGITLLVGLLTLLFLREVPAGGNGEEKPSPFRVLRLVKEPEIRMAALPAALHGVIKENITLWMTVYFVDRFGVDLEASADFVLLIPLVGLGGRLCYGPLLRWCRGEEHRVSQRAFLACVLGAVVLYAADRPVVAMICLSLLYAAISVINTSFLSVYPLHFRREGSIASVSGFMDFCTYLGGGISSSLYGLMNQNGKYGGMFLTWAVISVLCVFAMGRLRKSGEKEGR